jgi:hypothetical protein
MSEVAALLAAFEQEFNKALSSLPPQCDVSKHDAYLNHSRGAVRVSELIAYYASKLSPSVSIQRILSYGERLLQKGECEIAKDCYRLIISLQEKSQTNDQGHMDSQQRLSYHIQALIGLEVCLAAIALQSDPSIKHPRTLAEVCVTTRLSLSLFLILIHSL